MITINRRGKRPLHISLPDFDKGARCPGWSGEGMKRNKTNWCDAPTGVPRWALTVRSSATPPAGIADAYDLPGFYRWRLRRTNCCNTIVMPQILWRLHIPTQLRILFRHLRYLRDERRYKKDY